MNYLKNIAFIFFSFLLFTACEQDEEMINGNSPENISFKLSIPTSGNIATRAGGTLATDAERTIGNVYILIYENAEEKRDVAPVFFHSETNISKTTGVWEKSFIRSLMKLEKGETYKVYALANMPQNASGEIINAPTKSMNKKELSALIETLSSSRKQNGSDISFSAIQDFTYTGNETSISLDLIRTVARLNVVIIKDDDILDWTIESIVLSNENTGVNYFVNDVEEPVNTGNRKLTSTSIWSDGIVDGKTYYHYYPYENEQSVDEANQLFLTMTLKDKKNVSHTYKAIVNSKGNSQLKRDYIYTMEIMLKDTPIDPVTVTCNVISWKDAEYTINIGGKVTYLDIPDTIYFSGTGEGILPIKTDAENIKVILNQDNSRLYFGDDTSVREMSIDIDSSNMHEVDLRMTDLTMDTYEEPITVEAGHLTKSVRCIRKDNLLSFSVIVKDQADENFQFAPDFGESLTGVKKDSISIKIIRNVEVCYFVKGYFYQPGAFYPNTFVDETVALPLTEKNTVDEINLRLTEAPFGIYENPYDYPVYIEIKIGLFDLEFPYIYKTLKYTILPKSNK